MPPNSTPAAAPAAEQDIVKSLDALTTATGLNTQHNRRLPQAQAAAAIPARTGSASSNTQATG